jgi:hypothetical protein
MRARHKPGMPGKILQLMPWPVYGKMQNCDPLAV